ncbi:flavonol 4'-sulfotransferase [Tanacetum coccineum]
MDHLFKTLPQHTCSWSKGKITFYKYQGFWDIPEFLEGGIITQQSFKAQPNDIFLCSCPKTGTTWLKALAFAIVTREKFNESTSPLLTTMPHECIPFLEKDLKQIEDNHKNSRFPLVATHLSYTSLPELVISSDCKIETFNEFCQGISAYGPYWDHILGYWKASQERPGRILFLKYEDMKKDPKSHVKKLAEFIGYPFSIEEESG